MSIWLEYPEIWSNIILDIFVKVFSMRVTFTSVVPEQSILPSIMWASLIEAAEALLEKD